jgi:hypothetical protein
MEGGLEPARGFSLAPEFLHFVQLGRARWWHRLQPVGHDFSVVPTITAPYQGTTSVVPTNGWNQGFSPWDAG